MSNNLTQQKFQSLLMSSRFAGFITLVLVALVIYLLAQMSWSVWSAFQPRDAIEIPPVQQQRPVSQRVNVQRIAQVNLFGDATPVVNEPQADELNAPVTRLKLTLRGVYSSTEETYAGAMIEASNEQKVYRVGDRIPGATGLRLHRILADRVILSRSGKYETLFIEDFTGVGKITGNRSRLSQVSRPRANTRAVDPDDAIDFDTADEQEPLIIDKRADATIAREIGELRAKLDDPESLGELLNATPFMEEGQFKGFKIAPGSNRVLFGKLGLRRNDIVTGVNGISMDDPQGAFALIDQMTSADEINITINRGGREVNLIFSAQSDSL